MIENIKPTDRIVADVSMYQIDMNPARLRALKREIADKYHVPMKNVTINQNPIMIDENGKRISLTSDIITNIQDPKFQQALFGEYIKAKNIEDVDMDMILAIDNEVNAHVDFDSYSKYKSYKFKYAKWKNFLSYGDDNYIDFTKLKGLILLCGSPQNQSGKTTLARNLLRFALFGRSEKTPNLASVFNRFRPEATEMCVEVGIEIEGEDYVIRRTVTRPALSRRTEKSKCKQSVEYFKIIDGELNLIENCEEESTRQTNNIIRESIGSIEDFDLIVSATAKTLGDLFSMGQTDQGKLFSRWLGLLSLERKEEIAKEIYKKKKEPNFLSRKYDKKTLENEIVEREKVIKENKAEIKKIDERIKENTNDLTELDKEKTKVMLSRKAVDESIIKTDVTTVENNIASVNEKLSLKKIQLSQQEKELEQIKDYTFNPDDLDKLQKEVNTLTGKNGGLRAQYDQAVKNIDHIKKLIEQKICPNCGHEVDVNKQGDAIAEENKKIDGLIKEGNENKAKIKQIEGEIEKLKQSRDLVNKARQLKPTIDASKTLIESYKQSLETLNKTKETFEKNKENIKYNNEIDNQINLINTKIKTLTGVKEENIRSQQTLNNENTQYGKDIKERKKLIEDLTEEEKEIRSWNIYKELIGKNGITKIVLRRALPIINNEVDVLLNGLVDFDVKLSVSEDNKICIDMIPFMPNDKDCDSKNADEVKLEIGTSASGYEETMASLAVRSALSTVSSFAKPNLMVFDEIISTVSPENYDNFKELFLRIMKHHDFILHITHNEMITDWHDQIIEVVKENNISKIVIK